MVVIHDAAGCTGNYVNYDEPRWYDEGAMVYCSGLRELDAVLGNDEKLIRNICEAARRLHRTLLRLSEVRPDGDWHGSGRDRGMDRG